MLHRNMLRRFPPGAIAMHDTDDAAMGNGTARSSTGAM